MKVKTLIEKLNKMNPEAEVRLNGYEGETALFLNARANDDSVVWLDGEQDFNLGEEISARFERAEQTGMSELDFYKELYEIGITGLAEDILEKYMDEKDIEYMKVFCIRNGLI